MKRSFRALSIVLMTVAFFSFEAAAQEVNFAGIATQLESMSNAMAGASFLAGIFLACASLFHFKAFNEGDGQGSLSKPIIYAVVSAALIFSSFALLHLTDTDNRKTVAPEVLVEQTVPQTPADETTQDERTFKTGRDEGRQKNGF